MKQLWLGHKIYFIEYVFSLVCSNLISLQMPVDLIDVCNDVGSKFWFYVDLWAQPAPIDINGFHLMDQITRNILCYIEQQESV